MTFRSMNDANFFAARSLFTLVLIFIVAAATTGCGGGGNGSSAPQPKLTITGHAINDAVANGTVRLETLDGRVLGQTRTDGEGAFAIETSETEIAEGYQLVVTGGQVRGQSFRDELRARYLATEDHTAANVTLLTTLVGRMAGLEASGTPMQRRESALRRMNDLGALEPSQWNAIEPEGVALENLRVAVVEHGFDDVVDVLASQLHAGEFNETILEFFPNMFGGLVSLRFGDERNRISDFAGSSGVVEVQPITTVEESYGFALETGPGWIAVHPSTGTITYAIPDGTATGQSAPFSIRVTNDRTGLGRSIQAAIFVMEAETLAEGSVGPEGGAVMDAWGEVVIDVEAGAASVPTQFRIIRARDAEGNVVLSVRVDGDTDAPYRLLLPEPEVLDANTPADMNPQLLEPQSLEDPRLLAPMGSVHTASSIDLSDPTPNRVDGRSWYYVKRSNKRLPYDYIYTGSGDLDVKVDTTWELWGPPSVTHDAEPVLFIHGYTGLNSLGGGCCSGWLSSSTWENFTPLVANLSNAGATYQPYEFRWRTDARFQDVALDLARAVHRISQDTGRQVHIIAHSFGGVVVRSFLQGLTYSDFSHVTPKVASVTTVGTPHSGIFGSDGGNRNEIDFPDGRDGWLAACGQISCYQMGDSSPWVLGQQIPKATLGLDLEPGYIAQRLAETIDLLPDIPIQVLIGLTAARIGTGGFLDRRAEGGDALISFSGQRLLPNLREDWALLEGSRGQARVSERLLGYDEGIPQIVPGVSVRDRWLSENYKGGYRHTNNERLLRGDARQVGIRCSTVIDCEHDVWLKTRDFLAAVSAEAVMSLLFTVNGAVRDAAGQGIPGVRVIISEGGIQLQTVTTDTTGNYAADVLFRALAEYTAVAVPPAGSGYRAATATGTLMTGSTLASSGTTLPVITLAEGEPTPGTLAGVIRDAQTANLLPNAQYRVVNSIGFAVASGTTSDGRVTIAGLPPGSYSLFASAPGYRSGVNQNCAVIGAATSACSLPLSPELATAETMRIVLSWGQDPHDLDSHLVKYNAAGQRLYRLAFYSLTDASSGDNLDVDVTTSFGPETITIQSVDPSARYVYAVHHFSGAGSLTSTSNARVTVSYGAQSDLVFNVPPSGTGNWWKVFEVDGGTVIPCTSSCLFDAGGSQEDIALQSLGWPLGGETDLPRWLSDMTEGVPAK